MMSYEKMQAFRKRMKKLSKDELINRMIGMMSFIDDLVGDE